MNKNLFYDNKSLADFGIRALCLDPFTSAEPDIETTHIEGMDGDLHFYPGSFQNIEMSYLCIISTDFTRKYAAFKAWFNSKRGYKRLEDPIYPDLYRMARTKNITTKSSSSDPNSFEVTFDCKPQHFLKSGDQKLELSTSGTVYNPTFYNSRPLIRIYGTGDAKIGSETVTISKNDNYIDLDSEVQDAFCGSENKNSEVQLSGDEFPVLVPGSNSVTLASGMRLEITPRWFTR